VDAIASLLSSRTITNEAKRLNIQTSGNKSNVIVSDEEAIEGYLGKERDDEKKDGNNEVQENRKNLKKRGQRGQGGCWQETKMTVTACKYLNQYLRSPQLK